MAAEIRRHQTTLICSGLAVIAFGAWSIVRAFLMAWFNLPYIREIAEEKMPEEGVTLSVNTIIVITLAFVFVTLTLDLLFRLYVGTAAVAEGGGKQKRMTYIVLAFLFLVFSVCGQILLFVVSLREELTLKIFVTLFIEISSNIAFFEIIRSSLAIRRIARRGETVQGETYAA